MPYGLHQQITDLNPQLPIVLCGIQNTQTNPKFNQASSEHQNKPYNDALNEALCSLSLNQNFFLFTDHTVENLQNNLTRYAEKPIGTPLCGKVIEYLTTKNINVRDTFTSYDPYYARMLNGGVHVKTRDNHEPRYGYYTEVIQRLEQLGISYVDDRKHINEIILCLETSTCYTHHLAQEKALLEYLNKINSDSLAGDMFNYFIRQYLPRRSVASRAFQFIVINDDDKYLEQVTNAASTIGVRVKCIKAVNADRTLKNCEQYREELISALLWFLRPVSTLIEPKNAIPATSPSDGDIHRETYRRGASLRDTLLILIKAHPDQMFRKANWVYQASDSMTINTDITLSQLMTSNPKLQAIFNAQTSLLPDTVKAVPTVSDLSQQGINSDDATFIVTQLLRLFNDEHSQQLDSIVFYSANIESITCLLLYYLILAYAKIVWLANKAMFNSASEQNQSNPPISKLVTFYCRLSELAPRDARTHMCQALITKLTKEITTTQLNVLLKFDDYRGLKFMFT